MTDEPADPDEDTPMRDDTVADGPEENIVHFNPWRDFNDAAPQIDVFGDEPDPEQIARFMQVVFGYCDGLIPVPSFIDKGQGIDGRPHNIWLEADQAAPAEGDDIARVCRLRGDIAAKVGGDMHFRSAHQPIRVAGSVYYKNSLKTQVRIVELNAAHERDLDEFIEAVTDMPPVAGVSLQPEFSHPDKPAMDDVLVTPVREGAQDDWSRFEGASAAIGHFMLEAAIGERLRRQRIPTPWDTTFRRSIRPSAGSAGSGSCGPGTPPKDRTRRSRRFATRSLARHGLKQAKRRNGSGSMISENAGSRALSQRAGCS